MLTFHSHLSPSPKKRVKGGSRIKTTGHFWYRSNAFLSSFSISHNKGKEILVFQWFGILPGFSRTVWAPLGLRVHQSDKALCPSSLFPSLLIQKLSPVHSRSSCLWSVLSGIRGTIWLVLERTVWRKLPREPCVTTPAASKWSLRGSKWEGKPGRRRRSRWGGSEAALLRIAARWAVSQGRSPRSTSSTL